MKFTPGEYCGQFIHSVIKEHLSWTEYPKLGHRNTATLSGRDVFASYS